jgi:hypothetical protein
MWTIFDADAETLAMRNRKIEQEWMYCCDMGRINWKEDGTSFQ